MKVWSNDTKVTGLRRYVSKDYVQVSHAARNEIFGGTMMDTLYVSVDNPQ